MIAVIFEVWPAKENRDEYFDIAATMRPLLNDIDGFISVERFESLVEPGKILSLSFFRDEEAVLSWRNAIQHRKAQSLGRDSFFRNYRLRVAKIIRDYNKDNREQAPKDSNLAHLH